MTLHHDHAIEFSVTLMHGALTTLDALGEALPAALVCQALDALEEAHPDPVARLRAARAPLWDEGEA